MGEDIQYKRTVSFKLHPIRSHKNPLIVKGLDIKLNINGMESVYLDHK
jgi:hypothetical protein